MLVALCVVMLGVSVYVSSCRYVRDCVVVFSRSICVCVCSSSVCRSSVVWLNLLLAVCVVMLGVCRYVCMVFVSKLECVSLYVSEGWFLLWSECVCV